MTKTNPTIDWTKAPSDTAVWCEGIGHGMKQYSGWHELDERGHFVPLEPTASGNYTPWYKDGKGILFEVFDKRFWHETGDLPPIGERVVIHYDVTDEDSRYAGHKGLEAVIIGHDEYDGHDIAIYRITNDERRRHEYHALVAKCFKPVPTEEEKAAAAKAAFVREAHAICLAGGSWGLESMLQRLYDAGYRSPDENRKQEDVE